ncbi:telomere repeat binding factor-domain-containing protein [Amylocarpus encephaloides]|uniref:Telomere repeat binding factor-domain-containing protein n=1 Tax=Amylocarpus encephaloides TaxID=45428 RepID=A0A9P7YDT0_9HELO|nr:telomere repeat binding factor-domain-containing protein [Amylocarpus encephaloides]
MMEIKYEKLDLPSAEAPQYQAEPANMYQPQSPSQKRGPPDVDETSTKRQKLESPLEGLDLEAMLARATAGAILPPAKIDHQEQDRRKTVAQNDHTPAEPQSTAYDPELYMWVMSLPILENLSIQLLSTLAHGPYTEIINIISTPDSEQGQAYATIKSLFDQTKKIYSKNESFLSADDLSFTDPKHRSIIRNTNMAAFVASVFGSQEVGFYELNSWFLNIFTPERKTMESSAGMLFVNLKTQMYLSACGEEDNDRTKEDILEEIFPSALGDMVMSRHPEVQLSQSEKGFLSECQSRKAYLSSIPSTAESIFTLSEQFPWEHFLQDLSIHIGQAYSALLQPYMKRHDLTSPTSPRGPSRTNAERTQRPEPSNHLAAAEMTAQQALLGINVHRLVQQHNGASEDPQEHCAPPLVATYQPSSQTNNIPYHTQSAPTQVLYNLARQAAVAKTNPGNSRQPGPPSQRRPWSTEEENALMAGLDRVRGPHWSQILALYGEKGSISNILSDRNQVQLKDKARNLKLFFLKSDIEVPYYLQSVTGELKTRAPGQAARKEAGEKAKQDNGDARAHFEGVMVLGQGLQEHHQDQSSPVIEPETPRDGLEPPEKFQVTDQNNRTPYQGPPQPVNDDERLRQQLMAANSNGDHGPPQQDVNV